MKKLILFTLVPLLLTSKEKKHEISWKSNFLFESNSLDKNFLNKMIYGGYITSDIKSRWINAGEGKNIIHAEISNGISYTYYSNKQTIGFSFSDINTLNASFSDDLLRLALNGNSNYQDENLSLSNSNIRSDKFQQYKIIYGKTINNVGITGGISYLAGNYHISYIIDKGSVYTAANGAYLDIEYSINSFITDTAKFTELANNGNGVAMDLSTDFSIQKYDISLSISDLGFIIWNKSSITMANDSTFIFEGIEVEDIFSFNDSILETNNIQNNILRSNKTSFKSYVPATVHLSLSGKTKYRYLKSYTTGIVAKWQPYMDNKPLSFSKIHQGFTESNFSPLYYIQSIINIKNYNITPSICHGGYSNNTNVGLALSRGKKNKIIIGTNHLENIFNGDKANAISLYLNLKLQF